MRITQLTNVVNLMVGQRCHNSYPIQFRLYDTYERSTACMSVSRCGAHWQALWMTHPWCWQMPLRLLLPQRTWCLWPYIAPPTQARPMHLLTTPITSKIFSFCFSFFFLFCLFQDLTQPWDRWSSLEAPSSLLIKCQTAWAEVAAHGDCICLSKVWQLPCINPRPACNVMCWVDSCLSLLAVAFEFNIVMSVTTIVVQAGLHQCSLSSNVFQTCHSYICTM